MTSRQSMKKIIQLVQEYFSLIQSEEFKNNQDLLAKNYIILIKELLHVKTD